MADQTDLTNVAPVALQTGRKAKAATVKVHGADNLSVHAPDGLGTSLVLYFEADGHAVTVELQPGGVVEVCCCPVEEASLAPAADAQLAAA